MTFIVDRLFGFAALLFIAVGDKHGKITFRRSRYYSCSVDNVKKTVLCEIGVYALAFFVVESADNDLLQLFVPKIVIAKPGIAMRNVDPCLRNVFADRFR